MKHKWSLEKRASKILVEKTTNGYHHSSITQSAVQKTLDVLFLGLNISKDTQCEIKTGKGIILATGKTPLDALAGLLTYPDYRKLIEDIKYDIIFPESEDNFAI